MRRAGYAVEVPATVDELRDKIIDGNAARFGAQRQCSCAHSGLTTTSAASPGSPRSRRNGARRPAASRATAASIFVLGERFGNVFVGVQPAFGYEGDPMRLLFEKGFAPTHAFSAFYRWLREEFGAHAVLHLAPMARSNSCPASRAACPDPAGRTG